MSKKVYWISRHDLTPAQVATIKMRFPEAEIIKEEITFGQFPNDDLFMKGIGIENIILGVFPCQVWTKLLAEDFMLGCFENTSSARNKGVFLCKSLFIAQYEGFIHHEMVDCPISLEDQEPVSLEPLGR